MQLSIEDNELTSLAGVEPLVNLMELYAGERRGGDGGCCHNCVFMVPISQEQHSPIGLLPPPSGNNRIPELREAQRLRELPKLIILDLSGNPCTSGGGGGRTSASALGSGPAIAGAAAAAAAGDDYRLYVVYNVRKLKV